METVERARDDELTAEAVALVRRWLAAVTADEPAAERRHNRRFRLLVADRPSVEFTMAFADRVLRPDHAEVAARQLRAVTAARRLPSFLSPLDRLQLTAGAHLSRLVPGVVMALARRRLRQLVGDLVV